MSTSSHSTGEAERRKWERMKERQNEREMERMVNGENEGRQFHSDKRGISGYIIHKISATSTIQLSGKNRWIIYYRRKMSSLPFSALFLEIQNLLCHSVCIYGEGKRGRQAKHRNWSNDGKEQMYFVLYDFEPVPAVVVRRSVYNCRFWKSFAIFWTTNIQNKLKNNTHKTHPFIHFIYSKSKPNPVFFSFFVCLSKSWWYEATWLYLQIWLDDHLS